MKRSTELISEMTSVERIVQYIDLPQEEPIKSSKPLPDHWPSEGKIIFKDVFMKYDENGPLILKVRFQTSSNILPKSVLSISTVIFSSYRYFRHEPYRLIR